MVSLAKTVISVVLITDPTEIKSSFLREILGFSLLQRPSSLPLDTTLKTFLQPGDLKPLTHDFHSTNHQQQFAPSAVNNF